MPLILDGKLVANHIKTNVSKHIGLLGIQPRLAVVLVGNDRASQIYVRNKEKDCIECGIESIRYDLPENTTEDALYNLIKVLSEDDDVHGILIQLPLPSHINTQRIISAIAPEKDVDCFTPHNVGLLNQGIPAFLPCTPSGVLALLDYYDFDFEGRHCVIVGRSNIVGKPMASLLLNRNATVTVCHSHTKNLAAICQTADVLITATGKAGLITPDHVKPDTIIIDVGMNRDADGKLCGDCDPAVYAMSAAYTPVPGGVGPMTRAMLMVNTAAAAISITEG